MEKSINGFYCFRLTENKENALLLRDKGGAFLLVKPNKPPAMPAVLIGLYYLEKLYKNG